MAIRCEHGVTIFDEACGQCDLAEGRKQERADVVAWLLHESEGTAFTAWVRDRLTQIERGSHVGAASKEKKL